MHIEKQVERLMNNNLEKKSTVIHDSHHLEIIFNLPVKKNDFTHRLRNVRSKFGAILLDIGYNTQMQVENSYLTT